MPYGLLPTGFSMKPTSAILDSINAQQLALISASLDVQPTALMGVINGIVAAGIGEVWQILAALYAGMDPDAASDDQLASLSLLTGTKRDDATATIVKQCTVHVESGFFAAAGTMFANVVGNTANLFFNLTDVDNSAGVVPANISVDFLCQDTGPIQALADTLTVISQPLTGWDSIRNPTDGLVGNNIETDPALRIRRQQELSASGATTPAAIASAILQQLQPPNTTVATVSVTVLNNDTDATDANGLPPHSIGVVSYAPGATSDDDQKLADLIMNEKAAGDDTYGTSSKTSVDSQGNSQVINYTRPTGVPITVAITVVKGAGWPGDTPGTAAIKQAMVDYAMGNSATSTPAAFLPGQTVYSKHLAAQVFQVPGAVNWTAVTANAGDTVAITPLQVATLSTSDITVTLV